MAGKTTDAAQAAVEASGAVGAAIAATSAETQPLATCVPLVTFDGYPFDPTGSPVRFSAGRESIPVPADYIDLLKSKGLVSDK